LMRSISTARRLHSMRTIRDRDPHGSGSPLCQALDEDPFLGWAAVVREVPLKAVGRTGLAARVRGRLAAGWALAPDRLREVGWVGWGGERVRVVAFRKGRRSGLGRPRCIVGRGQTPTGRALGTVSGSRSRCPWAPGHPVRAAARRRPVDRDPATCVVTGGLPL